MLINENKRLLNKRKLIIENNCTINQIMVKKNKSVKKNSNNQILNQL
jgi:hypothetical protein